MRSHALQIQGLKIPLAIITLILVGWVLHIGRSIFVTFFLAIFLAYLLMPMLHYFRAKKIPLLIRIILAVGIIASFAAGISYIMYSNVQLMLAKATQYTERVNEISAQLTRLFEKNGIDVSYADIISNIDIPRLLTFWVGSFLTFLGNFTLVIIFLVFIFLERELIQKKLQVLFKNDPGAVETIKSINEQIQTYISLKVLISAVTAIFSWIALELVGVEFASFFSFIIFLLNFIPNLGSIIAGSIPVIFAFVQFENWWPVIITGILMLTIQMVLGNFIEPRLQGKSLHLSPLMIIIALVFWGSIWGIVGMILSVPIMAAIHIIAAHIPSLKSISVILSDHSKGGVSFS